MDTNERAAFEQWLARDTRNRDAYEAVRTTWNTIEEFRASPFPARDAALNYRKRPAFFHFPSLRLAAVIGIVFVATMIYVTGSGWNEPEQVLRTAKGESRSVVLSDGSRVVLNTDSELRVAYTRGARTIHLDRGEALFTVSSDRARPFEVIADSGRIVDLSTSFNVYKQPGRVAVTVTEGAVSVSTVRTGPFHLARGDMLTYTSDGDFLALARVNPDAMIAWQEGKIRFDETPLEDVMKQLTRYHSITYRINDPAVGRMKISGTFRTNDLALMLDTLEAVLPVSATVIDGGFVQIGGGGR